MIEKTDALADFYFRFRVGKDIFGGGWTTVSAPQGYILNFQEVETYIQAVWPWKRGEQQQMAHMDFKVDDLAASVAHALNCGARKAAEQYSEI